MNQQRLWAPWRGKYISTFQGPTTRSLKCLFCQKKGEEPGFQNLILKKGATGFSILNLYPYNNGHLLIAPFRHVSSLERLSEKEWGELLSLSQDALARLKKVLGPHGYNMGINVGRVAGAGIPGHLHLHILPRWRGDTNFITTFANTRVVSHSLRESYRLLRKAGPHGS